VLTPEKVPLHHNKKKEMDDNFIFQDNSVLFFFLVGVIKLLIFAPPLPITLMGLHSRLNISSF